MTKWTQDVVDAQSPEGGFSDVSPRIGDMSDGAPAWGDAGVIVPWTIYLCYGDKRILETHYDAMAKWIEYIRSANPRYLLWKNRSNNNFGDWLSIDADTPRDILATSYFAYSTSLVAKIARILGKPEAGKYEQLFEQIKAMYNMAYVRPDGRIMTQDGKGDTQTCYLLALRFNLLPENLRPLAAQHLIEDVVVKRKNHLSTGFVGVGYLTPTLTDIGRVDVAYKLLQNDTFPSWGYSIKYGATTIWERWDGWTAEKGFQDPGMNSFNHYSLGSVGEWMYHTVAGIDLDPAQPGYKHIVLHPQPGGGLTYAKASYDSLHGRIVSDWKLSKSGLTWKVVIPANTTATVRVPTSDVRSVRESGNPITQVEGVTFLRSENGAAVYEVGSGEYTFTARQ
jgi:alpha-L-rhamnosidase